jgi:outer membrane receptor protein involved in Fe transport
LDGDSIRLEGTDAIGRELLGQSPWLANLQFGFDHYETEQKVTLLVNFFDDRIYRVTRGVNNTPEYEKGRVLVDLNYEKLFGESLTFQAQIKNLLNEKVQYEMNDRVIESYEEGTSLSLKLEYQFQ